MVIRLNITGSSVRHYERVYRDAKGRVRDELKSSLIKPTNAAVKEVRKAILAAEMPAQRVRGARRRFTAVIPSKGVRRPIANAVQSDVSTRGATAHAEILLNDRKVPERIQPLVGHFVGRTRTRLRHPIMGRRSRWVSQHIPDIWWPVLKPKLREYRTSIEESVDRIADRLGK